MKKPRSGPKERNTRRNRHPRSANSSHVSEMLKLCLEKICELQAELEDSDEVHEDPHAAGYAACVSETLRFLTAQGLTPDHPVVKALKRKLLPDEEH